jgi:hypothetical protein
MRPSSSTLERSAISCFGALGSGGIHFNSATGQEGQPVQNGLPDKKTRHHKSGAGSKFMKNRNLSPDRCVPPYRQETANTRTGERLRVNRKLLGKRLGRLSGQLIRKLV